MLSINRVMITGRLTRDPETKYLPSGQALTSLGVAVNRHYQDRNGEWREETMFLDVDTWGKVAERAAETLRKGQPVYVEGRLKQDTWERDGVKQSKIKITADMVKPFEVPSRSAAGPGSDMGEVGEPAEGYSAPSGSSRGGSYGSPPRPSAPAGGRGTSGSPSDNLDFSDPSVQDDIPF